MTAQAGPVGPMARRWSARLVGVRDPATVVDRVTAASKHGTRLTVVTAGKEARCSMTSEARPRT
ncbi:hypothetical protein [Streptomyces thermospinosisporus]|uniref:hypothetical protein n=1 Tax=Streptomyces thermospinosisporus TaxID=161482 RepID=UPI0031D80FA3